MVSTPANLRPGQRCQLRTLLDREPFTAVVEVLRVEEGTRNGLVRRSHVGLRVHQPGRQQPPYAAAFRERRHEIPLRTGKLALVCWVRWAAVFGHASRGPYSPDPTEIHGFCANGDRISVSEWQTTLCLRKVFPEASALKLDQRRAFLRRAVGVGVPVVLATVRGRSVLAQDPPARLPAARRCTRLDGCFEKTQSS